MTTWKCHDCESQKEHEKLADPSIYRLPCSYTGLDAELDNCDPPADVIRVDAGAPQAYGYTRYLLLSGEIVDINIDQFDFADWFEVSELVEVAQ